MSECYIQVVQTDYADAACRCDNCYYECRGDELEMIHDIEQRLDPMGPTPAGECPECGALSYMIKDDPSYDVLHDRLSDMIEGGRLTEAMIPDDYKWLVDMLAMLANLDATTLTYKAAQAAQAGASMPLRPLRQDLAQIAATANDTRPGFDEIQNEKAAGAKLVSALRAIQARINGVWDDPNLMGYGALGTTGEDCLRIASQALAAYLPADQRADMRGQNVDQKV